MTSLKLPLMLTLTFLLSAYEAIYTFAADNDQHSTPQQVLKGHTHQLTYAGKDSLPDFKIDGLPARIHTQGIYVTKNSLYVTGRLERTPKRALFLRFNREDFSQVEFLDITPIPDTSKKIEAGQDHPGGFDFDGKSFWIPVAVSKPHSPTTIIKIHTSLDSPLSDASTEIAFVFDDHIGALAVDRQNQRLYGANWDTKEVYLWSTGGTERKIIPRNKLVHDHPTWALAVQDWKCLSNGTILASGFDKDPSRDKTQSRATLDWLDVEQKKLLDRIRIISPEGDDDSLTREGMTLFDNDLFLLPGDLGDNATLYRYRVEAIDQ